jgi:hypothetical protein
MEAGRQIGQQRWQLFQSALEVLGPHLLDVTQVEQPFRFVRHGQKHDHNLSPRGPEFDENASIKKRAHTPIAAAKRIQISNHEGEREIIRLFGINVIWSLPIRSAPAWGWKCIRIKPFAVLRKPDEKVISTQWHAHYVAHDNQTHTGSRELDQASSEELYRWPGIA